MKPRFVKTSVSENVFFQVDFQMILVQAGEYFLLYFEVVLIGVCVYQ